MSKDESRQALEAYRRGERPHCEHSMHRQETGTPCAPGAHRWRVIACDFDRDLDECSVCGRQVEHACNFDDEYS